MKEQLEKYWQWLLNNKQYWASGFTSKRLEKVKPYIFSDENIIFDLLQRHGGKDKDPKILKTDDLEVFKHAIGNFSCDILYKMINKGIYKSSK